MQISDKDMNSKKMCRVLWFTHHLRGGGAEKAVVALSEYFNSHPQLGYESYICVVYDDPELHAKLQNVLVLQNRSKPEDSKARKALCVLRQMKELRKLKERWEIDVCVSFLPGADILNVHSGKRSAAVVSVRNVESRFTHSIWKKLYVQNSYNRCNRIVTVSELAHQDVVDFFQAEPSKVTTIYNMLPDKSATKPSIHPAVTAETAVSADGAEDRTRGTSETWQEFISFIKGKKTFLNVARLSPEKGQEYLLRAFSKVHKEMPDTCLVIAGSGPLQQDLTALADDLDILQSVLFTGNVPDPENYMAKADVFVLASLIEGMPNVVLEAMQSGLPVIATECGAREILAPDTDPFRMTKTEDDAKYGILVPAGDAPVLSGAMIHMMQDHALRRTYSEKGRERTRDFMPEEIAAKWKSVLDSSLQGRQQR